MSELNISATKAYSEYQASVNSKVSVTEAKSNASKTEEASGVVYEKSEATNTKGAYTINKMSAEDRAALVEKLKADNENRKNQLSDLVRQMLSGQANASNLSSLFSKENLKNVSAEDIAKAKEDISEDGYWGVKQTAQRMFDFASALAGDDVDKMKEMQEAMEKGFKQATKAWGKELPSICQDTMKAANQLFEDYYNSKVEA